MRKTSAISLIEVVIAIGLVAVYALGLIETAINASRLQRQDSDVARATCYAQDRLEYYSWVLSDARNWSNGRLDAATGAWRLCGNYDYAGQNGLEPPARSSYYGEHLLGTPAVDDRVQNGKSRMIWRFDVLSQRSDLIRLRVTVAYNDTASTSLAPDRTMVNGSGVILQMTTLVNHP